MNVTRPEIISALWYLAWTDETRIQKNTVEAIIDANENESTLYTSWNCPSLIANITMVLGEGG